VNLKALYFHLSYGPNDHKPTDKTLSKGGEEGEGLEGGEKKGKAV